MTPNNVIEKLSPLAIGPNTEYWSPKVNTIWVLEYDEMTNPVQSVPCPACHEPVVSEK